MVKLSKPGQHPEYVSYLEQIDDENVLKALEALRVKAKGGSSKAKLNHVSEDSTETIPTIEVSLLDTSQIQSKLSILDTPLTPGTVSSSSSASTPINHKTIKSGTLKGGLDLRSRMAKGATTSKSKEVNGTAEFVPKWKLQPLIKRRSIPTWELVTAAQEKFAADQEAAARSNEEVAATPSLPLKAQPVESLNNSDGSISGAAAQTSCGQLSNISPDKEGLDSTELIKETTLSGEPFVGKNDTIALPEGVTGSLNADESQRLENTTHDKVLATASAREKDLKLVADFMESKVPVKKVSEEHSGLSAFFSKLDCFSIVDPIIEPTTDFEDNFTYCSATDESDASNRDDIAELPHSSDENITDDEKEAIEFLNERGLDQLPPLIYTLSKYNDMVTEEKSDPTHLEHISNMLCNMECKLQHYGGYRRRIDREQPESEPDIHYVFAQIDALKKLIFRIVEDFIDDHVVNPWNGNGDVSSLPSALLDGEIDSLPTATDTLDDQLDSSTLGDDSLAQPDLLEGKDVTISIPLSPSSSGQNHLPSLLGATMTLTSDMSTKKFENVSMSPSQLESGDAKFVSADLFDEIPTLPTIPPRLDNEDCAGASSNQDAIPEKEDTLLATHKTRAPNKSYLMKNLSRLLSRSSKKRRPKNEAPEDRNPSETEETSRTVKKIDSSNTGSPTKKQESPKMKSQSSPARRFFGSRQVTKSQSVENRITSITLQEAVDNNGSAITEIESVAHGSPISSSFLAPSQSGSLSPTSVLIVPESSHDDHELCAIESIVGTEATVM